MNFSSTHTMRMCRKGCCCRQINTLGSPLIKQSISIYTRQGLCTSSKRIYRGRLDSHEYAIITTFISPRRNAFASCKNALAKSVRARACSCARACIMNESFFALCISRRLRPLSLSLFSFFLPYFCCSRADGTEVIAENTAMHFSSTSPRAICYAAAKMTKIKRACKASNLMKASFFAFFA